MGFEDATVDFLLSARRAGFNFDRVLTVGRQGLHVSEPQLSALLSKYQHDPSQARAILSQEKGFAEPLLKFLGAKQIDSLDVSHYEAATILHDMNQPLPDRLRERYSLVIDGGSLEHVFHYTVALKNCMEAVEPGGHFVTITPANNLMGHGFYQFSPELFYRVFSPDQGFDSARVIVFETPWDGCWYDAADPERVRSRVELFGGRSAYLIAFARRISAQPIFAKTPQQSDYVTLWTDTGDNTLSVADTRPKPPAAAWKRFVPQAAFRLYRRLHPYHPRYFRRRKGDFFI